MSDLQTLADYLARRDVEELSEEELGGSAEVLVLCGSAVLRSVEVAAQALESGAVSRLVVSGGIGHSTPYLREAVGRHRGYGHVQTEGLTEAAILAELLALHGVAEESITLETKSTNCGENARFTVEGLGSAAVRTLVLVQDPTMQRRTHASFERCLRDRETRVVSFAPLIPRVDREGVTDDMGRLVWTVDRFTSLVLGEVRRLHDDEHGYGPRGADFIDHVDVPSEVMVAYRRLAELRPEQVRAAWTARDSGSR